ncbi:MAG: LysE family transporter, partial [Elusimicrobia bacterium]|nr:LysE family transporter [Elusimicrobiota bacterium]
LRSWQRPNAPAAAGAASPGREFALGVALCATNPLFLGFWLSVISWCRDGGWLATGAPTAAAFLAGVAAGDAAWFALLSRLGAALGAGGGAAVLGRINGAAGLLFLGAAAWCVLDLWRESFG